MRHFRAGVAAGPNGEFLVVSHTQGKSLSREIPHILMDVVDAGTISKISAYYNNGVSLSTWTLLPLVPREFSSGRGALSELSVFYDRTLRLYRLIMIEGMLSFC